MELEPEKTTFKAMTGCQVLHISHQMVQALFEALHLPCAAFHTAPAKKDLLFQPTVFWLNLTPAKPNGSFSTVFNGSRGRQTSVLWKAAAPHINLQSRQHPSIKFAVRHSEIVFQMKQARKKQKLGGTEKEGNPWTAV